MATGTGVLIDIRQKGFSETGTIFFDLSLKIRAGQVVALIGPSGVGKSTLLRTVAGIDNEFEGSVNINISHIEKEDAPGFVFQDPRLLPWETALGNIRAVKPDMDVEHAKKLLSQLGLSGVKNRLPNQMSGGMQRRVALARALVVQPHLLLLDEPFVSIDRELANELRNLLSKLIDDYQPTVLLVTHDPMDAAVLADRVVLMSGKPAQISDKLLIERPRSDRDHDYVKFKVAEIERYGGMA